MKIEEGYVYHIKNEYFRRVRDDHLMQNKEHGGYRPALLCFIDQKTGLLWFVPLSSRTERYKARRRDAEQRYGKGNCLTIEIGQYCGTESAFLLQNMFPALPADIHHIHLMDGEPVPVKHSILKKVRSDFKKIREITKRGKKTTFTNIKRLEAQMLHELRQEEEMRAHRYPETKRDSRGLEERVMDAEARKKQYGKKQQMRRGPPLEKN